MSKKRFSVRAIIITAILTLMVTIGVGVLVVRSLLGPRALTLLEGLALIEDRFVADYDPDVALNGAMTGMVNALGDRWSHYLDPAQRAELDKARQNAYVGIGVTYLRSEDPFGMELVEVAEGGPAREAGLAAGDYVTAVDSETLTGENFDALVASIGDREGGTVELTVQGADGKSRTVRVAVRKVDATPVEYSLLE